MFYWFRFVQFSPNVKLPSPTYFFVCFGDFHRAVCWWRRLLFASAECVLFIFYNGCQWWILVLFDVRRRVLVCFSFFIVCRNLCIFVLLLVSSSSWSFVSSSWNNELYVAHIFVVWGTLCFCVVFGIFLWTAHPLSPYGVEGYKESECPA